MNELPTGNVTFLLSDIQGSTKLWEQHPEAMKTTLARHDILLRDAIEAHHGHVFKTMGDAFYAVFSNALDAVGAAATIQRTIHATVWEEVGQLQVRLAIHSGEAELREGDYFGASLNRIARLIATAHGGQTLVTSATQQAVANQLPAGVELRDMGERRLKDIAVVEHVYQLVTPELQTIPTQPIICSSCGAVHLPNTLFCDECGHLLTQTTSADTDALTMAATASATASALPSLRIILRTLDGIKQFAFTLNNTLLVGRTDTSTASYPDIDLGGFEGFENGVSRRHARLMLSGSQILLEDLNSLNGTFVQGMRLIPHRPYALQSGDELQFGKVVFKITW